MGEPLEFKDTTANPAPLGLLGFGMTTILLNIHNAGFYDLNAMILGMGIFYGGLAQIVAGIMEWKKKNTFGAIAFGSYGFFWLTLVAVWVLPKLGWANPASPNALACYLLLWGLFTFGMFCGTFNKSNALKTVFGSLTILFVLLAIGDITESPGIKKLAGYEGIFCGFSAFYTGIAEILNENYKKPILPLGQNPNGTRNLTP